MVTAVNRKFWEGKKVFLTGHTGFKGAWLALWLQSMGAKVTGFALEPPSEPSLFKLARIADYINSEMGDIRNLEALSNSMAECNPDVLIHMAAQALVKLSYREPVETYATNIMGTVNVLEAARSCANLKAILNVTTDKCYENKEWVWGYRECEPMGGHDPYSSSKGCSELITSSYRKSFFCGMGTACLASARSGNVIGGGDWSQDRLIPDVLKSFQSGHSALIRSPGAIRPWQHVVEPLSGYLLLAERLYNEGEAFAEAWNFGPNDSDSRSVEWILDYLIEKWGRGANWKRDEILHPHEATCLKLDISKSREKLGWTPRWSLEYALDNIIEWHKAWLEGRDIQKLMLSQIELHQSS